MNVEKFNNEEIPAAHAIVKVLEQAGIDRVFGMQGGASGQLFRALGDFPQIKTYVIREESSAAVMAEVSGRLTGRPYAILGQGSWVLGNGIIGILEAYLSSTPMLILTEFSDTPGFNLHGPFQLGTGDYGGWNARQCFAGVTKQLFEAHDPVTAVQATQLAIKHSLTGQPGPVAVIYGRNAFSGVVKQNTSPSLYSTNYYLPTPILSDFSRVEPVAHAIAKASKPVLVVGNGVRIAGAYKQLIQLAETTGMPVVTTGTGKGCFPETHDLAGGVFGPYPVGGANEIISESDLLIVVGSKLGATDTSPHLMATHGHTDHKPLIDPSRQTIIQIDTEPRNVGWTQPVDHALIGDAGETMDQLSRALDEIKYSKSDGVERVKRAREESDSFDTVGFNSDAVPISPLRVIGDLNRYLPDNLIVTCDAGENRILMNRFFRTRKAGGFLQAAGSGPMGYAIPAAIAAKLHQPDSVAVAVCGDGGFAMTMHGLMSAVQYGIPIVVIVFNNSVLGWVMKWEGEFAGELSEFDHAAIARGMGCDGIRVTRPEDLQNAISKACASKLPTVIDVVTSLEHEAEIT
jgi:acetolactate synthase I/II/III large subunit